MKLEYNRESCAATLSLAYYQNDTHARVTSTIRNEQCAASSGSYLVRIRYLPDNGEMDEVEYQETWSRGDDADVVIEKDYYVGEAQEVKRVRGSKLTCTCAEPAPSPE